MRQNHANDVYECYNGWINTLILNGKSFITTDDDQDILTKVNIEEILKRYIENYDETKGKSFSEKVLGQFDGASYEVKLLFAHAEWLWAMAVTDISIESKRWVIERTIGEENKSKIKQDIAPKGFGAAGTFHKNNKYGEIKFVILLLKHLFNQKHEIGITTLSDVNKHIELICNGAHYDRNSLNGLISEEIIKEIPDRTCAMFNILTYCAFPEKYERIASDGHKARIVNGFTPLIDQKLDNWVNGNVDDKIALIRSRLSELTNSPEFDFYEGKYRQVWNFGIKDNQFDEIQALNSLSSHKKVAKSA